MPINPQQQLAAALKRAKAVAPDSVLQANQLPLKDRALLKRTGFLVDIIKGWYALTTPQALPGDTTFWHMHYWAFVAAYLKGKYGEGYCISAEHSLDLWTEATQTPKQLLVVLREGGSFKFELPNQSSLIFYPNASLIPPKPELKRGIQVMPLALALVRASPTYFRVSATNAELALRMVRPDELSRTLLTGEINVASASRLVGGLRHIGRDQDAHRIAADLKAAGIELREQNPFAEPPRLSPGLLVESPYAGRIEALWARMKPVVLENFPAPPEQQTPKDEYLRRLQEIYTHDAYNSLSIEGYQVTEDLIRRIADGAWNPAFNPADEEQKNAMAARGYHEAFQKVLASVGAVLDGAPPGRVVDHDLQNWYRALFSPSVQANLIPASALAGYRERRVFIRTSDHVPPSHEAVPALMETFFRCLQREDSPPVCAILGHFVFVYIHPYSDGNGRIGRFLMNTLLAAGGYNWTVVRLTRRAAYMAALEKASVGGDIADFTHFIAGEMAASAEFLRTTQ